jgi:antitoxin PrlF
MNHVLTTKEIPSSITSKGQVTLPSEVRKHLHVATKDRIAFVIQPGGTVQVKPLRSILSLRGAAGNLPKPLPWKEIERIAHEDRLTVKKT